jgi:hypothetical protein
MTPVFLPRYPEPCKVPTNPHWCPYAKGSPREGQAPRSSNSVESREPSPCASGAPLPAPLDAPRRLHYRASGRNAAGLVPSGTRWRLWHKHGCHSLARISPHSVQLQRPAQESRGCVVCLNSRLAQGPRLARGPPQAVGAPSARPKPSLGKLCRAATSAKSPYHPTVSHAHLMRGSPDTLLWHTRLSRQGRSDRSHFTHLLTVLTGKQRYSPRSDYCANHQGKAESRPPPSSASGATGSSASPDHRPQPRKKASASPDLKPRPQPRPREGSHPRPTSALASGDASASPDLGLGSTAPQGIHHYPTPS